MFVTATTIRTTSTASSWERKYVCVHTQNAIATRVHSPNESKLLLLHVFYHSIGTFSLAMIEKLVALQPPAPKRPKQGGM